MFAEWGAYEMRTVTLSQARHPALESWGRTSTPASKTQYMHGHERMKALVDSLSQQDTTANTKQAKTSILDYVKCNAECSLAINRCTNSLLILVARWPTPAADTVPTESQRVCTRPTRGAQEARDNVDSLLAVLQMQARAGQAMK